MKKRFILCFILSLLIFIGCGGPVFAQTRYLYDEANGYSFSTQGRFSTTALNFVGLNTGISIGGRFGLFAVLNYGLSDTEINLGLEAAEKIPDLDQIITINSNNLNLVFGLELAVLKQSSRMPLNCVLQMSYGFDFTFSDDFGYREYNNNESGYTLSISDIQNRGTGFEIGTSIFRDFFFIPQFSFRIGANMAYRGYQYSLSYYQEVLDPDADPAAQDDTGTATIERTSREDLLLWGGLAGFSLRLEEAPIILLECKILFRNFDFERIYFEPTIGIVQSFYR